MRAARPLLLILLLAAAAGCDREGDAPDGRGQAGLREHLDALAKIAARSGGTRAAGTAGYAGSLDYVQARLTDAGWRVRRQSLRYPYFRERSAELAAAGEQLENGPHFRVLSYSGSGRAAGRVRRFGQACGRAALASLRPGQLPLVRRGGCFFRVKAAAAERAGAAALLVADDPGGRGAPSATLGAPGSSIPVLVLAGREAEDMRTGSRVKLAVDAVSERRITANLVAETRGGGGESVVMAGGHLDSVPAGPGLNDNGSGVAALIEVAEEVGPRPPGAPIRLAFWAAEELGLVGSRRYVASLGKAERRRIAAYVNLDMVGSPNAVVTVYEDGDPRLAAVLRRALGGARGERAGGASDHAPFAEAGIPVGGIYTGSVEPGPGGEPRDPCYHQPCDTRANVNLEVLGRISAAVERALLDLSRRGGR